MVTVTQRKSCSFGSSEFILDQLEKLKIPLGTTHSIHPSIHPVCHTHLRLLEEYRPLWVDAAGQQAGCHVQNACPQLSRVLGLRDGVQVHDAVQH